jgi:hypothetical protein
VFDKDGALINFYLRWGRKTRQSVEILVQRLEEIGDFYLSKEIQDESGGFV